MSAPSSRGVAKRRPSHPCTRCGKDFTKRSNMLIHERLHTGERPYVCRYDGCGRSYKWLSSINFHEGRCERKAFGLATPSIPSTTLPPAAPSLLSRTPGSPGSPVTPVRFSAELVLPSPDAVARLARRKPAGRAPAPMPPPRKRVPVSPVASPPRRDPSRTALALAPAPLPRDLPLPAPFFLPTLHPASVPPPPPPPPPPPHHHHHHHHHHPPAPHYTPIQPALRALAPTPPPVFPLPATHPDAAAAAAAALATAPPLPAAASAAAAAPSPHPTAPAAPPKHDDDFPLPQVDLFPADAQQCTVTGGVLDELTTAGYSFESDPAHSEVLLF